MFQKKGFTLIELIISLTIFGIIIVIAFDALGNISTLRTKNTLKLNQSQDLFYSLENLFSTIKDFGGDIDYEEYFNRYAVGASSTSSGHYLNFSGYGNYGSGGIGGADFGDSYYYCRSGIGATMGDLGCLESTYNTYSSFVLGKKQRYGQYYFQFIDYNANKNDDGLLGDEDGDLDIKGDDDDENLGLGPVAINTNEVKELYLIKRQDVHERMYLRLNYVRDPSAPPTTICNPNGGNIEGCRGTIQILKLRGYDIGLGHGSGDGMFDGIIDTWQCDADYPCSSSTPTNIEDGWIDLLPNYINVKDFKVYIYPTIDSKYAWKNTDPSILVNPYVRINIEVGYSWLKRRLLNDTDPTTQISTTINLKRN